MTSGSRMTELLMARRFWPAVHEARPRQAQITAHRAMADAEESLQLARYYSTALGATR